MSLSCLGRRGAAAAVLLALLFVDDVVADPPQPATDVASPTTTATAAPGPAAAAGTAAPQPAPQAADKPALATADQSRFETFLDRLMRAESGGRDSAANPRSTALGPYQFIKSTFLDLARRHFGGEIWELSEQEILRLRTDRSFSRRCAETYSRENLAFLSEQGIEPTFGHLRLAFLLGPFAAARVLQAAPATPVADVLGPAVIRANPFMARMSASNLIAKTARDVGETAAEVDIAPSLRVAEPAPSRPVARALSARHSCNPKLASCRKFAEMQAQVVKLSHHVASAGPHRISRHLARMAPSRVWRTQGHRTTADTKRRGAGA
ncbi:MAG TPA: hypothetical protein VKF35_17785 [Hyphomicrobiaceae bacterium]|nr:hypothetical protein [Hyphomicrobiaceae bacterium]